MDAKPTEPGLWAVQIRFVNAYVADSDQSKLVRLLRLLDELKSRGVKRKRRKR